MSDLYDHEMLYPNNQHGIYKASDSLIIMAPHTPLRVQWHIFFPHTFVRP